MNRNPRRARGLPLSWTLALLLAACAPAVNSQAQSSSAEDYQTLRQQALDGFHVRNAIERLPLLEKLAAQKPDDAEVLYALSVALLQNAATLPTQPERTAMRLRARQLGIKARELGSKGVLLDVVLDIPEDGSQPPFSPKAEVEKLMHEGEAAFASGQHDQALAIYQRALALDPDLYHAALFLGDVYFVKKDADRAGEWFARAIAIDPNVETAYRYWGDALLVAGRYAEAREKFIEAVIADPYNRRAWNGLFNWSKRTGVQLSHPRIESPNSIKKESDSKMTITIDPATLGQKDGREKWMSYEISKAAWTTNDYASFKKEYPEEKTYRHSLMEEVRALRLVAENVASAMKKGDIKKLHPSLEPLLRVHEAGLMEAYVLLARADEGIARDYVRYRAGNRDKLVEYMRLFVAPAPSADKKSNP
jgi:tetratricopeptide (TPR) repeat protein